ncbi:MAG: UDP-2,3-diacylglucosamine diphosphatase [Gammaproteobacteria bacterium]|nr:UDP-2,3-diacylglucosamine diphosphatase [Gammaproteobacteria bacterium]
MATLFISDLHLTEERPEIIALFRTFLREQAAHAEALYILGDLFEAWLGDDAVSAGMQPVLDELSRLTESGVPVFVLVGNRDFLIGERFAEMTGCTLLPDPSVIKLYGTDTLLMHGDTLCTDDVDYQQFRRQVRDPAWQAAVLAKTIDERMAMAREARAESTLRTREKSDAIMDVNEKSVLEVFRSHGVTRLIHGHTHRPAIHQLWVDETAVTRIVLGDWYDQSSVLSVSEDGVELTSPAPTQTDQH